MISNRYKRLALAVLSLILLDSGTLAGASEATTSSFDDDPDVLFQEEYNLSDEELDTMRGGFLTSNGMIIDFIFSTNTLIDGELVNQIVLNSANPALSETDSLRNIVQIGQGNSAFSGKIDVAALPNILTVIQNNVDNLTIQQVNLLDLTVQNFDSFVRSSAAPEIAFQSTLRLTP